MQKKSIWWLLAGFVIGGFIGVIGGYIINDLTSKENPEVVKQMQEEEQRQDDIDNLLDQVGSQKPNSANSAPPSTANETDSGDTTETR